MGMEIKIRFSRASEAFSPGRAGKFVRLRRICRAAAEAAVLNLLEKGRWT